MTTFIISLSVDNITTQILAESAMRHYLSDDRPAPLTPDRRTALEPLVRNACASLAVELRRFVAAYEEADDGENIRLTIKGDPAAAEALRRAIEQVVALRVMARVYAALSPTVASALTAQAATLAASIIAVHTTPSLSSFSSLSSILAITPR